MRRRIVSANAINKGANAIGGGEGGGFIQATSQNNVYAPRDRDASVGGGSSSERCSRRGQ